MLAFHMRSAPILNGNKMQWKEFTWMMNSIFIIFTSCQNINNNNNKNYCNYKLLVYFLHTCEVFIIVVDSSLEMQMWNKLCFNVESKLNRIKWNANEMSVEKVHRARYWIYNNGCWLKWCGKIEMHAMHYEDL